MSVLDSDDGGQLDSQRGHTPDSGTGSVISPTSDVLSATSPGAMSLGVDSDDVDSALESSVDAGPVSRLTVWMESNMRTADESRQLNGNLGPLDTALTKVSGMPGRRLRRPFSFSAVEQSLTGLDSTVSAVRVSQMGNNIMFVHRGRW